MNNKISSCLGKIARVGVLLALCSSLMMPTSAFAEVNNKRFAIGKTYNTGLDSGYWNEGQIGDKDPHANWDLGQFYVTGYEFVENTNTNNPTFVVAPEKTVSLLYKLEQDLELINNDPAISINWDSNGSERVFGIGETDFGRGALFVESEIDGEKSLDAQYDFLVSTAVTGEEVEVGQYGTGSYRVSLDYEIKEDVLLLIWISIFPSYTNYKDTFFFNVRTATAEEMANLPETDSDSETIVEQVDTSTFDTEGTTEVVEFKREPWQLVVIVVASMIAGYMVLRSQWGPIRTWFKKKDKK